MDPPNISRLIKSQEKIVARSLELSGKMESGASATHDIHYLERADWQAHEILINIQSGEPCEVWEKDSFGNLKNRVPNPKRQVAFTHDLYFKSPEEMRAFLPIVPMLSIATLTSQKNACRNRFQNQDIIPSTCPPSLEGKSLHKRGARRCRRQFPRELCAID